MRTFTENEIKKAFWKEFHATGEVYFCNVRNDKENNEYTKEHFDYFFEQLLGVSAKRRFREKLFDRIFITIGIIVLFLLIYGKFGPFL